MRFLMAIGGGNNKPRQAGGVPRKQDHELSGQVASLSR